MFFLKLSCIIKTKEGFAVSLGLGEIL
jgi:hypothetical protein